MQVGLPHAGKTAKVTVEADTYQITVDDGATITAARRASRDIRRQKVSNLPSSRWGSWFRLHSRELGDRVSSVIARRRAERPVRWRQTGPSGESRGYPARVPYC
jgi:hypothetical protein